MLVQRGRPMGDRDTQNKIKINNPIPQDNHEVALDHASLHLMALVLVLISVFGLAAAFNNPHGVETWCGKPIMHRKTPYSERRKDKKRMD